jgi:hypothetical protein
VKDGVGVGVGEGIFGGYGPRAVTLWRWAVPLESGGPPVMPLASGGPAAALRSLALRWRLGSKEAAAELMLRGGREEERRGGARLRAVGGGESPAPDPGPVVHSARSRSRVLAHRTRRVSRDYIMHFTSK